MGQETLKDMEKRHIKNVSILKQAERNGEIKKLNITGSLSTKLVMSWVVVGTGEYCGIVA